MGEDGTLGERARVRGLVRLVCTLAVAALLAAPLLLGPAMTPVMRALGATPVHLCACGMEPGKCGCPECERLADDARDAADLAREHPTLRSTCEDADNNGGALPAFDTLPIATLPYLTRLAAPAAERTPPPASTSPLIARDRVRPPTPPPRATRV